ncbi:MAG: FAD-dependent oxidoreductase, partial [Magnetococcales bacterium]|nr:FAD-dependent oxidoreductase [Magnetococcales bacterium]
MTMTAPGKVEVLRFPLQGSRLIEASAGTGKTFTITALYIRLVLGHGGETIVHEVERVLIATGRVPNGDHLGLEKTRVVVNGRGEVLVNGGMQTDDPALLAIGDLVGGPMLAHKAAMQARVAVATLSGESADFVHSPVIPAVTYTDPELAWAGLT